MFYELPKNYWVMNYYVVSPNIFNNGDNYADEMFRVGIAAIGWGIDSRKGKQFQSIKNGDCIIVAQRAQYNWKYYYIGLVCGNEKSPTIKGTLSKKLSPIIKLNDSCGLNFEEWSANGSHQISSPQRIKIEDNQSIIRQINIILNMKLYTNLLSSNHNLILTGAPGTGKTFLAKQIAAHIIIGHDYDENNPNDKAAMDEQFCFVQFHPSYDYTDFVEGLRPIQNDNVNIGFERRDGVFKEFCAKAQKNYKEAHKTKSEREKEGIIGEVLQNFLDDAISNGTSFATVGTGNEFFVSEVTKRSVIIRIPNNERASRISVSLSELQELLFSDASITTGKNVQEFFHRKYRKQEDSYTLVLYTEIKKRQEQRLSVDQPEEVQEVTEKKYVFVIDEINRWEISKIFGELFFSIDPGYRGEKVKVTTQYQNLVEDGDVFKQGFFVPENVYIIGTMNDIDRSVESMDFAMRRRFAFKEIKADDTVDSMIDSRLMLKGYKEDIKARMKAINDFISNVIQGLSDAYHIGGAYFLKLENYLTEANPWNSLWDNHLKGLLYEYLRGMPMAKEYLKELEKRCIQRENSNNESIEE